MRRVFGVMGRRRGKGVLKLGFFVVHGGNQQTFPYSIMSSRRRPGGGSAAYSESARRTLMQPVEGSWVRELQPIDQHSSLKVYRWVKTSKPQVRAAIFACTYQQQFSDDEEPDAPLAPIVDEVAEVDEDEEDAVPLTENQSTKQPTPIPADMGITYTYTETATPVEALNPPAPDIAGLDSRLGGLQQNDSLDNIGAGDLDDIHMSGLGPDGIPFEGAHDIEQVGGPEDHLLGGAVMDDAPDPFADISKV